MSPSLLVALWLNQIGTLELSILINTSTSLLVCLVAFASKIINSALKEGESFWPTSNV